MHLTRIVIIDDLLAKLRPCYVPLRFAYGAEKPTNLTSDIRQFVAVRFQPTLAVRAVESVDLLHGNVDHLHQCLS